MDAVQMKDKVDEVLARYAAARVDLLMFQLLGDKNAFTKARRDGIQASIDLADLFRAGAEAPLGLVDETSEHFAAAFPAGSTVDSILARWAEEEGWD